MLCDNCGKREANVRYSENINGRKKELHLCEECSKKLGIENMDFNMPIDFSSFFGGLLEDFGTNDFMPLFNEVKQLKCDNCGYTFEDIVNTGKVGCENCYKIFYDKMIPSIERLHGNTKHVGKVSLGASSKAKLTSEIEKKKLLLKEAIDKQEFEQAAKIRDQIKKMKEENDND